MSAKEKTPVKKIAAEDFESKANSSQLAPGDFLSRVSYCQVVSRQPGGMLVVRNKDGFEWSISEGIVEAEFYSADQFDHEHVQKMTKTELVELLLSARDAAFTVAYHKQLKMEDAIESMANAVAEAGGLGSGKRQAKAFLKKTLPDNTQGELRVLQGHMLKPEPLLGRSHVWDFESKGIRLVDHRTVQWLILRGVKYELK
ncbi:MAG: hypothetical protein KDB07_03020 [Planctomycetes bacterium]|nr:hypothetical protein [Planctomycetota bacterium]